jgi:Domain of unknown function (DUF4169)
MNNVVNLNKFKKKKSKEARQRQAETNRRLHGRTKAERASEALQKQKLESAVDHARLEREAVDGGRAHSEESEPTDQET